MTDYAELEGLRQCMNHYRLFGDSMVAEMKTAIHNLAATMVAKAQEYLKTNGSIATGALRASGSIKPQTDGTIDAGFGEGYAYFVEYGRKAGKFPPVSAIKAWVWKKKSVMDGIKTDEDAERVAYLIARHIKAHGTKPHPFLMPAVAEEKKKSNKFWREAYRNAVNAIKG